MIQLAWVAEKDGPQSKVFSRLPCAERKRLVVETYHNMSETWLSRFGNPYLGATLRIWNYMNVVVQGAKHYLISSN